MPTVAQQVFRRKLAQTHRHRRMNRLALFQRLDELEHFAPVLQLLLRAQHDLLRVNAPRALRLHFGERDERAVRVAAVGAHVGGGHETRVLPVGFVDLRKPFVAPRILMHAMRRRRRDQAGRALVVAVGERVFRGLLGTREAPAYRLPIASRSAACAFATRERAR